MAPGVLYAISYLPFAKSPFRTFATEPKVYEMHEKIALDFNKQKLIEHVSLIDQSKGWLTPVGRLRVKRRIEIITTLANLSRDKKILEIGCGAGEFTSLLNTGLVVSIDLCWQVICKAKNSSKSAYFVLADAEILPFKSGSFDCVIGISVLQYLNLELAINEFKRVLKPKGLLVFTEPNLMNPHIAIEKTIGWIKCLFKRWHKDRAYLRWELYFRLKKYGIKNIVVKPFDWLYPLLPSYTVGFFQKLGMWLEKIPVLKEFSGSLIIKGEL